MNQIKRFINTMTIDCAQDATQPPTDAANLARLRACYGV